MSYFRLQENINCDAFCSCHMKCRGNKVCKVVCYVTLGKR